jgi:hypothetical protein
LWLTGSQIYDTVIIDEIETMNMMWQGGLKNPGANKININFPRFKDIIRGASKVYVMDAFMCARTVNLLKEIDPVAKVVAIKNPEPAPKRTFVSVPDKNTWIAEICSQLKDGKNLFVFYPYKNSSKNHISMEQLAKTLSCGSGLDISDFIFYNADQSDEIKKTTRNVNAVWTQKRCIITNTSITVGVNFDSLYFDTVFAWNVNWVSARDFFQVLYRCRTIKTNNVYLFQQGGGSLNPWIHSDLQDPIYRNLLTGLKYEFNSCGSKEVFNYFSFRANIHFGGKISEASKQVKTEIDEIITKSECLFRWDKIEDIGYDKYEVALHQIINSFTTSIDTGLQVRKYIFKQLFHNSTPETTLADIWNQHRFRAVDGVHALIALGEVDSSETKIVKSIFGNSENLELPKHVKWDYDIQAVRECFETRVVGEQAKYNSQLISNILKAYFGMSVFVSTKERSHIEGQHGNQLTDYKMTEQFLTIKNELLKWIDRGEEKHELREFSFTDDY